MNSTQQQITIGDITPKNNVFLAPMSGVSDLPFRQLAHRFGAGLVFTEMVASENLCQNRREACRKVAKGNISPHVVQLAGRESKWMAEGARVAEAGGADIIDINMGCPSKRVTTGYSGSALMKDLSHALCLIESVVNSVKVPVTLKMRLGWDDNNLNAPELAVRAENAGIKLVTVHGRTRCQFFKGTADWQAIQAVSEAVKIPVIANGDCSNVDDARNMLSRSKASGIMVGRASYGRPWLAGKIANELQGKFTAKNQLFTSFANLVHDHYESILSYYGLKLGMRVARKHLSWYLDTAGISKQISKNIRRMVLTNENPKEVSRLATKLFADHEISKFI